MKNLFITAALIIIGSLHAQDKRNISDYTKLSVLGGFDVKLNANATQISIDAKFKDDVPHVKTEVANGTLKIYMEEGYRPKKWGDIKIEVPFKALEEIYLMGSGDINSLQPIASENLTVTLVGSGDIVLEAKSTNIKATVTGSGDLKLKGITDNFKAEVAGSGDLTADALKSQNTKVHVNGSGDASVNASAAFFARVNGSGDIRFSGNPQTEDSKVTGSGSIKKF